ncbi:MAG: acetate kinase, partial [Planctomycetota bacterium]
MKVLVINAGSSSVKYYLYDMPKAEVLARGSIERIGEEDSELMHFVVGESHVEQARVNNVAEAMELMLETLMRDD